METNLERRFGFLVADVGRLTGRRFDELSRATLDLTRAQYRALACLTHYGEINQACLADLMEVAPISAGRLLDRMEEGGWIVRRPNPADRRERMVSVTEKAEQALHAAREVGDVVTSEALNGFNAEEAEQFIGFLQRARGICRSRPWPRRKRRHRRRESNHHGQAAARRAFATAAP
jgi:DNA-binding MarR family transcriptional regulator